MSEGEEIVDDWGDDIDVEEESKEIYLINAPDEDLLPEGYVITNLEDIEIRVDRLIEKTIDLFGLDMDDTLCLLKENRWNSDKLEQIWFDNMDKMSHQAGILVSPDAIKETKIYAKTLANIGGNCLICYGDLTPKNSFSLKCNHSFCDNCWKNYLLESITEARKCIFLRCPFHKCNLSVPPSQFIKLLQPPSAKIYKKYLYKSYTDDNKMIRWCPNAGCIFFAQNPSLRAVDIQCKCGTLYCFKCGLESHRPVICEMNKVWNQKANAESENVTWILANTKECPKCNRCIEKNQGCNHIHCSQCGHDFCWICMGLWSAHGQQTGGYYKCNVYEQKVKDNPSLIEKEKKAEEAKTQLAKYIFYFERYNNHLKAEKIAIQEEVKIEEDIELFHSEKSYPIAELEFFREAISTIIDCRRILKNSYIFGYYLEDDKEKNLFQFMQQQLEENADYLHEMIEQPKDPFLNKDIIDRKPFYEYKSNLIGYASTTKNFYKHLLEGLEVGLTKESQNIDDIKKSNQKNPWRVRMMLIDFLHSENYKFS